MRGRFALFFILSIVVPCRGGDPPDLLKQAGAVLAQLEGHIALPGLKEPVEVLRDGWGIPHIYARNAHDLFFAQGFVAAQDRLFQLDWWRRVALGETAEVFGAKAIEADRFARLLLYRGDLEAEWKSYSPDTRQIATAFTQGINACIDHLGDKLPIEFKLLGYAPKKWRPEDILGRMSGIIMSRNFQQEILRAQLVAAIGVDKARKLAPTDPPRDYAPAEGLAPSGTSLKGIGREVLAGYYAASRVMMFEPSKTQSNNWVVSGNRALSGKPLLASDPHRAMTIPSLRYLVHLNAPGWNVIGSGEPALPGVAIGHNDRIAWGFTIVGTDQADFFVEEINPSEPNQYKVGKDWENMRIIRETLRVKGQDAPVEVELRFTRHGPVLYQDMKRNRAFALKWAGSEPGGAAYLASLAVDRAKNRREFLDALEGWKIPCLNFVYADVDGNIGWVAAALTPIRPNHDGLLPVPGNGDFDWKGYLPVVDLPQSFNPPEGFVATANHNILPAGYKHPISYEWAPIYRSARIKQRLDAKYKFDLRDFQDIQQESTSLPGLALTRLVKAVPMTDPKLAPYARLLAEWDGVLTRHAPAGPLYAAWLQELEIDFFKPHVPKELVETLRHFAGLPVMLPALEKPDPTWFGDEPRQARDLLVRATFARAVERVKERLGDNPDGWAWGKLHTVTFRHPLAALGPQFARAFNLGPLPRPGDGNTPNNTRHDNNFQQLHGATYRHVLDLADWDRGLASSAPGQSGQPGSPYYANLLPRWAEGEYFPLAFSRKKVEEVARHRLRLLPK